MSVGFGIERLLTREGEKPRGSVGRAVCVALDHLEVLVDFGIIASDPLPHDRHRVLNDVQQVIEVVCYPAGELAEGLHLLGLDKRSLRLQQLLVESLLRVAALLLPIAGVAKRKYGERHTRRQEPDVDRATE
jgi:hypothetical protein